MAMKRANAIAAGAAAKQRFARRARRARFFKENKQRLTIAAVIILLIVILGFLTPLGPDWYYGRLQERKMQAPGVIAPGYVRDLYKLAVFYNFTMRKNDALRCYDEIGSLYFGFGITEYSHNPEAAEDKRFDAQNRIKKGTGNGPPFKIDAEEIKYVGYSVWRVGEIIQVDQSRQFTYRIYDGLYLNELLEEHPQSCDPEITGVVRGYVEKFTGRR